MIEEDLKREEISITRKIKEKNEIVDNNVKVEGKENRRRRRWDEPQETPVRTSSWDIAETTEASSAATMSSRWDVTPQVGEVKSSKNRWDETPVPGANGLSQQTPSTKKR